MAIQIKDLRRSNYRATHRRCYHDSFLALLAGVVRQAIHDLISENGNVPEAGFWHSTLFEYVMEQLKLDPAMARVELGVE